MRLEVDETASSSPRNSKACDTCAVTDGSTQQRGFEPSTHLQTVIGKGY